MTAPAGDVGATLAVLRRFDPRGPRRLALIGALSSVSGATEAGVLALVTGAALGLTAEDRTAELGPLTVRPGHALVGAAVALAATLVVGVVVARLSSRVAADAGQAARQELLTARFAAAPEVTAGERAGSLQERLTTHVDRFMDAFAGLAQLLASALSLLSAAVVALVIDPRALVVLAVIGAVVAVAQRPVARVTRRASRTLAERRADYAAAATEVVLLGTELEAFGVGERAGAELLARDRDVAKWYARSRFIALVNVRAYQGFALACVLVALAVAGEASREALAGVAAVALIVIRSVSYGQAVLATRHGIAQQRPFVDALAAQVDRYRESRRATGSVALAQLGTVRLEGVAFAYDERPVLAGVDLEVAPGEMLGVVGASGAGKSTIVALLLGLRTPTAGRITVGGVDLAEVDPAAWSRLAALVPQEPRLRHGTVADNIRFLRAIDDAAVHAAARAAHVDDVIAALPGGYDAPVGELGHGFSGGQRQRIALARALAGGPQLLVLDEPTSALDGVSEAAVRSTLASLKGTVTMVVVAHRTSTLAACDRVVRLEGGRVVADRPSRH